MLSRSRRALNNPLGESESAAATAASSPNSRREMRADLVLELFASLVGAFELSEDDVDTEV
jgi:hypothetical protein